MSITDEQVISQYLARIGYDGGREPCLETLTGLHRQHIYRVMFENLDLLGAYTPNLDRDHLFDKIVVRGRGGVCYELNTSFYYLLRAMGFDACQISGAVKGGESMSAHVATLVRLPEGDYIADVGFADSFLPVLKVGGEPAARWEGSDFYLTDQGEQVVLITRHTPGREPRRMYAVSLRPRQMSDYFDQFRWAAAPGNTVFSQYPICVSHTPERRIVLRGGGLSVERDGQVVEKRPVPPGEETERCLREYFNL